jgi:hypothetical protein
MLVKAAIGALRKIVENVAMERIGERPEGEKGVTNLHRSLRSNDPND